VEKGVVPGELEAVFFFFSRGGTSRLSIVKFASIAWLSYGSEASSTGHAILPSTSGWPIDGLRNSEYASGAGCMVSRERFKMSKKDMRYLSSRPSWLGPAVLDVGRFLRQPHRRYEHVRWAA
jgi:hypothetical protein